MPAQNVVITAVLAGKCHAVFEQGMFAQCMEQTNDALCGARVLYDPNDSQMVVTLLNPTEVEGSFVATLQAVFPAMCCSHAPGCEEVNWEPEFSPTSVTISGRMHLAF